MTADKDATKWEQLAGSPSAWLYTAATLRECAKRLGKPFVEDLLTPTPPGGRSTEGVQPISFGHTFLMLAGYTIEALLKGILIARDPSVVAGRRLLPSWLTTHNLEALLQRSGVHLEEPLQHFVRRLVTAVEWSGRYPVPKAADRMTGRLGSSADLDWFTDIYELLEATLQAELRRQGPAGG